MPLLTPKRGINQTNASSCSAPISYSGGTPLSLPKYKLSWRDLSNLGGHLLVKRIHIVNHDSIRKRC